MTHDDIVNEVRRARAEILARFDGDVHKMLRDVMKRQGQSGHPLVTAPPRSGKELKAAETRATYEAGT